MPTMPAGRGLGSQSMTSSETTAGELRKRLDRGADKGGRRSKKQRTGGHDKSGGHESNGLLRELVEHSRNNDFLSTKRLFETIRANGLKPQLSTSLAILTMCCNAFQSSGGRRQRRKCSASVGNQHTAFSTEDLKKDEEKTPVVTLMADSKQDTTTSPQHTDGSSTPSDSTSRRLLALNVYEYMKECQVEATEQVYTMLVRCCCHDGELDNGLEFYSKMKDSGCRIKLRTLSPLIQLACSSGRLATAKELREEAQTTDITISEADHIALLEANRDEAQLVEMALDIHAPTRSIWESATSVLAEQGYKDTPDATVSAMGMCNACGRTLKSIDLTPTERGGLLQQIDGLVMNIVAKNDPKPDERGLFLPRSSAEAPSGSDTCNSPNTVSSRKARQWETFRRWLDQKDYDAVIDGANVGFFNNGLSDAVDFRHIDFVLRHCLNLGRSALVILHARHLVEVRVAAAGTEARDIVKSWRRGGHLYSCSQGNNDDWYWLYAAVKGGENAILVSNDEMRDHHFGMLSRRTFLVWKERHLTKFTLGPWRPGGARAVQLMLPLPFSLRMQSDESSWHIPASESLLEDTCTAEIERSRRQQQQQQQQSSPICTTRTALDNVRWLCLSRDCSKTSGELSCKARTVPSGSQSVS